MSNTVPYEEGLDRDLQDPEFVKAYLDASYAEGNDAFLVALGDVVRARGGIPQMAEKIGMARQALSRALKIGGNPGFVVVTGVLRELEVDPVFVIAPRRQKATDWGLNKKKKVLPAAHVVAASRGSHRARVSKASKRK